METRFQVERAMNQAWGGWAFCTRYNKQRPGSYSKQHIANHVLEFRRRRAQMKRGEFAPDLNERGNELVRDRDADKALGVTVHRFDSDVWTYGKALQGWEHLPTWQDASYFGVYFDRKTRRVFTYAEGDRTLVICPTDEAFEAELAAAREFYGPPGGRSCTN